jgi:Mg-chelatase subunit ChlD
MKPTILAGAAILACTLACSGNSAEGVETGGNGGTSSTGSTSSLGAQPNLGNGGSGGSVSLHPEGGGGSTSSPIGKECARQNFVLSSKPADVLLVLDRSKSMIENTVPPDDETRWDAVVPALTAVISATDSVVSWGLKLFPEGEGSECSASSVTDAIPAQIMPLNAATVNGIIMQTEALGNGTPTGDAILKATTYLQGRGASNQFILLATDGDPSCPDGDDDAEEHAISAITAAKVAGFPTYVIGVLDPMEDEGKFPTLNAMAEAGGTALSDDPMAPKFFQAQSQVELSNALKAVTGQVVSCVFEFTKRPPNEKNIGVQINGMWIEQDPSRAEGWEYTSDQFLGLELFGNACQQVKAATANQLDIIFGCDEPVR